MSTIAELNIDITGSTASLQSSMDQAAGIVSRAGDKMQSAGKALTVGVSAPLGAIGGLAINAANALNENLGNVQSLGVTQERVEELKKSIQDMSIAVGKDTSDLGDGLYQVVSAFGDSADTVAILETNAKAAAAGLATTTDAINLTSAVTKGYGDTSAEAVQSVADLAFKTVQLGQTTFPELASSMGRVVPLGASMGASMEELFGVMATATGVTGSAAEVSTQLRGVLQSLAAPTGQMSSLIEEWGFSSGQAALESMGLQGVIAGIVKKAEESGQPLQKYISSIEGQTLALALAGPQADVFTEKLGAMESASGAMDEAFQAQTEGINKNGFALNQARQKLNVFLQNIGDGLAPILSAVIDLIMPMADHLVNWADAFANLSPKIQLVVGGIGAFLVVLGPALFIAGQVVSSLSALAPIFSAIGAALGLVVSPLGLVIAGLAALLVFDVGGLRSGIVTFAEDAAEKFGFFREYIKGVLEDGDYLNDWIEELPESFQPWAEALGRMIAHWDDLKYAINDGWLAIKTVLSGEGADIDWWWGITGAIGAAFDIPVDVTEKWGDALYDAGVKISTAILGFQAAWLLFKGAVTGELDVATIVSAMDSITSAFGEGVATKILEVGSAIGTIKDGIVALANSEELATLGTTFQTSMSEVGAAIVGVFSGDVSLGELKDTVVTQLGDLGTAITDTLQSDAFQGVKTAFADLFNATGITGGLNTIRDTITSVFDELTPYLEGPIQRLKDSFSGISGIDVTPITDGLQSIKDAFDSIFGDPDASGTGFDLVAGLGLAALQLAIEATAAVVENGIATFQTMIDTVGNILTLFSEVAQGVRDVVDGLLNGDVSEIVTGVQEILTAFVEFFGNQVETITNLGAKIAETIYEFVGFTFEDIGILLNEPEWLTELTGWIPETPDWVTNLTTWEWEKPDWVSNLLSFRLPRPGWLGTLESIADKIAGFIDKLPFGGHQMGTVYSPGGLKWVGESGPELVQMPRGARVWDTHASMAMAGAGGVTINVDTMNVRNDQDIYRLAEELDAISRRRR